MKLTHPQVNTLLFLVTQRLDELDVAISKARKTKRRQLEATLWQEQFDNLQAIENALSLEEVSTRTEVDTAVQ
jgi:hypothetical protein